jgi:xanthine dehydrogenase accessory factor
MSWNWISQLEAYRREGRPVVAVTVTQCTGSTPRETGAKMLVLQDGRISGTIGGGHLEQLAIEDARKLFKEGASKTIRYPLGAKTGQCCGGIVELLFETLNVGPKLYLFGAGHVGQAICRTLEGTPFVTHLIDEREEWVGAPQLPDGVIRHLGGWEDFMTEMGADGWDAKRTYVAIMTFRHDMDERIVEEILRKNLPRKYLGLIGSSSKWERFKQRLVARDIPQAALEQVKCPIGLDLGGGKAPAEIAISVAAELLRAHYQGQPGAGGSS